MTIKLAFNAVPLLTPHTGIAQYSRNLMVEIGKLSDEIEPYYFYAFGWEKQLRDKLLTGLDISNPIIKAIIPYPHLVYRLVQQVFFTPGAIKFGANLYHEPNFLPLRFGGPTVITIPDLSHIRHPETHPGTRVRRMNRLLPKAIHRANQIITISEFTKREVISEFSVSPEKIHTTHLGVSEEYRPMDSELTRSCTERYGLIHGQYILAVGTLEPRKNLLRVLQAYDIIPDQIRQKYPLVIAGMKGWLTEKIDAKLHNLVVGGHVRMLGYIPQEALPKLYAGATMLVYPSIYEGFGLPPLEAMASGIPVITSNRSSMPEVVGESAIMVHPDDVQSLADAIIRLAEDRDERNRRISAGLERAKLFSWRACAAKTLEVYKMALSG